MLSSFPRTRVAVLGDLLLDRYLVGTATRLCREQPVPVIVRDREHIAPGGAGNVAANVRALGARVTLIGALALDDAGKTLRAAYDALDVTPGGIVDVAPGRTAHKMRVLAGDHYLARVDVEPDGCDAPSVQRELAARMRAIVSNVDVVVISDYAGGTLGPELVRVTTLLCREHHVPVIVDARELGRYADCAIDVVAPNLDEAALFAGLRTPQLCDRAAIEALADIVVARMRVRTLALTLGSEGVLLVKDGERAFLPGRRVMSANSCGAGDAFVAALALGIGCGAAPLEAASVARDAAAIAVAKPFTATVALAELRERLELLGTDAEPAITACDAVFARVEERRARGERIVFTNGVFDLLHAGHLALLQRARAAGDVLVVGLNSDASAERVKGPGRPITGAMQRCAALEALGYIDEVIIFDDDVADALLERLRPQLYVRGDDRARSELTEAAAADRLGIEVALFPCVGALTTSRIIARVTARSSQWSPAAAG